MRKRACQISQGDCLRITQEFLDPILERSPLEEQASHPWLPNKTLSLMLDLASNLNRCYKCYILESLFIGNDRIGIPLTKLPGPYLGLAFSPSFNLSTASTS